MSRSPVISIQPRPSTRNTQQTTDEAAQNFKHLLLCTDRSIAKFKEMLAAYDARVRISKLKANLSSKLHAVSEAREVARLLSLSDRTPELVQLHTPAVLFVKIVADSPPPAQRYSCRVERVLKHAYQHTNENNLLIHLGKRPVESES
jgi:hypothetical protein